MKVDGIGNRVRKEGKEVEQDKEVAGSIDIIIKRKIMIKFIGEGTNNN